MGQGLFFTIRFKDFLRTGPKIKGLFIPCANPDYGSLNSQCIIAHAKQVSSHSDLR